MNKKDILRNLFHIIYDWLKLITTDSDPHFGNDWSSDSNASAFYWYRYNVSSATYSRIGARLYEDDIVIWTKNEDNVTIVIHSVKRKAFPGLYSVISNEPIVYHNPDSEHKDFSEDDIRNLYIKIKEYLEKNKESVMLSNEENSENWWNNRYIKEQIVRTFDQSKFDIGKCYEVREIKQTNTELVFPCQCLLQNVYDTQLVFLHLKEDGVSSVFSINIQDIDNYEILKMITTH